jgi:hypothetical protein
LIQQISRGNIGILIDGRDTENKEEGLSRIMLKFPGSKLYE